MNSTSRLLVSLVLTSQVSCDTGAEQSGGTSQEESGEHSQADGDSSGDGGLPSFDSKSGDGEDDGDGGSGGGSTGNPDDHSENCGEVNVEADPLPPNIMLVLDKSGSMATTYWDVGGKPVTRWFSLHGVVSDILGRLDATVNFGLEYFPKNGSTNENDSTGCQVDSGVHVEVGPNNKQKILTAIPAADAVFAGSTPTDTGLGHAVDYMKSIDAANAKAIILVLDGETRCSQNNAKVAKTAAQALAAEIPVYVVGIALEDYIVEGLESVAIAGGTQKVYNANDADALATALEALIGDVGSCKIPLDPQPMFENFVKVVVEGKRVPWSSVHFSCEDAIAAGTPDVWVYTDDKAPWDVLELCGMACERFLQTGKVDITFECPPPG